MLAEVFIIDVCDFLSYVRFLNNVNKDSNATLHPGGYHGIFSAALYL